MTDDSALEEVKRQFFNSLKRGTGEAYLIIKGYPKIDFSDLIIKGAITNYSFDSQCEGSRATYIYGLIKLCKQKNKIVKAVLKKLQSEKNDYWGLEQMCDLALMFYKSGYIDAKTALYDRFEKNTLEGYEFCGKEQLIALDGWNGLLKVAEVVGENLLKDENDWEGSWHVDNFQKINKNIHVYKELEKIGETNKNVDAYLKSILKHKKQYSKSQKPTRFTYETVKDKIENNLLRFISANKANELSEKEVEKLASDFLTENNKKKIEQYLRFFDVRKFPFDHRPILELASNKKSNKFRVVEFACEALKHFSHPEIRKLAIEKFKSEENPSEYLCLLVNNYKQGDNQYLIEIANRSNKFDYIHSIAFGFIAIYEMNRTTECREALEIIYNKMNCGLHREDILKILLDNRVLSDRILKEMRFDSNQAIRRLYRKIKKDN